MARSSPMVHQPRPIPAKSSSQPLRGGDATAAHAVECGELSRRCEPSEREEFWLPAGDGTGEQIQGWIIKPPGFDPATKYPLLLEIHGGPAGTYGVGWFHEFQYFAAQGYVVVYCNPRGSQGYGEDVLHEHLSGLGHEADRWMSWRRWITSLLRATWIPTASTSQAVRTAAT